MSYTIKGTVIKVGQVTEISSKFSKREMVIETADNPKYPQLVPIEASGDRMALMDEISAGDSVSVEIDIRGRAWTKPGSETKYFLSLSLYKLERLGAASPSKAVARDTVGSDPYGDIPF